MIELCRSYFRSLLEGIAIFKSFFYDSGGLLYTQQSSTADLASCFLSPVRLGFFSVVCESDLSLVQPTSALSTGSPEGGWNKLRSGHQARPQQNVNSNRERERQKRGRRACWGRKSFYWHFYYLSLEGQRQYLQWTPVKRTRDVTLCLY